MLEKVKIFTKCANDSGFESLENAVKKWLAKKNRQTSFSVIDRKVTTCTGKNALGEIFVNCTITFFYYGVDG